MNETVLKQIKNFVEKLLQKIEILLFDGIDRPKFFGNERTSNRIIT